MKSVIITGISRSGKTELAKRLQKKTGYSFQSGDAIVNSFGKAFPEMQISQSYDLTSVSEKLYPFLEKYMDVMEYLDEAFIMDIMHLLPEQIAANDLHKKHHVICMGYPSISPEQKLKDIREFAPTDRKDWAAKHTDEELIPFIRASIALSQKFEESCKELGITFIDTSFDFKKSQDKAYRHLFSAIKSFGQESVPQ